MGTYTGTRNSGRLSNARFRELCFFDEYPEVLGRTKENESGGKVPDERDMQLQSHIFNFYYYYFGLDFYERPAVTLWSPVQVLVLVVKLF